MLHLCCCGAVQEEEGKKKEDMGLESQKTWTFKFCFNSALLFPDLDELGLKSLSLFFRFIKLIKNFRIKWG